MATLVTFVKVLLNWTLVKNIYKAAPKSLFWTPLVYQNLIMYRLLKKALGKFEMHFLESIGGSEQGHQAGLDYACNTGYKAALIEE